MDHDKPIGQKNAQGDSLRVAYADPPYIGQARKHYSHDPQCAEVNHEHLIWTDS